MVGKIFNKLEILRRDYNHKRITYLCRCTCGKEKLVRKDHLMSNKIRSCGCSKGEFKKEIYKKRNYVSKLLRPDNYGAKSSLFIRYIYQIKERIPVNTITLEEFIKVAAGNCEYCGKGPDKIARNSASRSEFKYTGVDRKDSTKGYDLDNVVTCCTSCNMIKNNLLTYEEMKIAMTAVLKYRQEKNDKATLEEIVGNRVYIEHKEQK